MASAAERASDAIFMFIWDILGGEEFNEQAVEMVHTALPCRRITTAIIEAGAHAPLHRLDHGFDLRLHAVEARAGAGLELRRVPHVRAEQDARAVDGERLHQVERQAP